MPWNDAPNHGVLRQNRNPWRRPTRPDRKRRGGMRFHGCDFGNVALREAGTRKSGLEIVEAAALDPNSRPSLWAKAADIRVVRGAGMIDAVMMPPAEVRAGTDGTSPEIGRAAADGASGQEHRPFRAREAAPRSASSGWGRSRQESSRATDPKPARPASDRPGEHRDRTPAGACLSQDSPCAVFLSRPDRFRQGTSTLRETGAGRSCRLRRRSR